MPTYGESRKILNTFIYIFKRILHKDIPCNGHHGSYWPQNSFLQN